MSETLDQVKAVIRTEIGTRHQGLPKGGWDGLMEKTARSAIEVMREPTEAMALAGARSIGNTIHTDNHTVRARECWKAMWAALDGIEEPKPNGSQHSQAAE